jgi:hypothetical protein
MDLLVLQRAGEIHIVLDNLSVAVFLLLFVPPSAPNALPPAKIEE